jgi:predicted O-methyltransferase YrrM
MAHSCILVTGADARYFAMAAGTIASIRARAPGHAIIGFFDLGCTPEQRQWLASCVDCICYPEWEFEFPGRHEAPEYIKGLLARPFLRKYFPGYDLYLWIDADAWVQDWRAVELFFHGAVRRGIALVAEIDRGSRLQYGGLPGFWRYAYECYEAAFGSEAAERYHNYPNLNAGVFALHKDAPHWQAWADHLRMGLQRSATIMTDQTALNLSIYAGGLFDRVEVLPAWCNWTCHFGLPSWDRTTQRLVEPYLPHTPIGILHLTSRHKPARARVPTTDGDVAEVSLLYDGTPTRSVSEERSLGNAFVAGFFLANASGWCTAEERRAGASGLCAAAASGPSDAEWDYLSPGLAIVRPDGCFPNMVCGDRGANPWPYLRREIPHVWYVDRRYPSIGFLSRDEASILHNSALLFRGRRALEIGCFLGWSTCHMAMAGVELDVVHPLLGRPEFVTSVRRSLGDAGVLPAVHLVAGNSPEAVAELAQRIGRWPFFFIDGDHDHPGPLEDARVCAGHAEDDALILMHDLACPDVGRAMDWLRDHGWQTRVYHTMQIMGAAWRGRVQPVAHQPDPAVQWTVPEHLRGHM